MSKYGNKRVKADGYTFDSKAEYNRYCHLDLLRQAGEIGALEVHPRYELFPTVRQNGETLRSITYVGDFEYTEYDPDTKQDVIVCEDVKGVETSVFRLKANLFKRQYPTIELRIVKV